MEISDIEHPVIKQEICSPTQVRRVAAMLDLDVQPYVEGGLLPRGWHFFLLAGETRKSALRPDGFPGLGVPMPELGLPRLLLGGRSVSYQGDIVIGSVLEKTSFIKNIMEKTSQSGRMAIVNIQHELRTVDALNPAIVEIQTYILLDGKNSSAKNEKTPVEPSSAKYQKQFVPDETLLFQYSALGFNSHKIHLDRGYAQNVEGLPDLVVNGGLVTLLLTEYIRTELKLELTEIKVKHLTPLFCNRRMTIATEGGDTMWQLKILDDNNSVAVEMEAKID